MDRTGSGRPGRRCTGRPRTRCARGLGDGVRLVNVRLAADRPDRDAAAPVALQCQEGEDLGMTDTSTPVTTSAVTFGGAPMALDEAYIE